MKQLNLYWLGGGGGSSVPDGRTVTPINDVTLLQQCAGIANPTYTSLSQILADTGILQTILSNQNAVNYLVRCTDFIKQKSVPTMTSDTAPSGLCFTHCTTRGSGYEAYRAFDNNISTYFYTNSATAVGNDLGYKFTEPVKITKIYYLDNGYVGKIKIQGSNDGITYTDITGDLLVENRTVDTTFENDNYYQYYRVYVTQATNPNSYAVHTMNFYTDPGFTDVEDAMRYIGLNNYAANTLLDDSEWRNAICNSTYYQKVLNAKVPVMTSNTTPSGVVSASGEIYPAYYAFDGNDNTYWYGSTSSSMVGQYIQYQFATPCKICLVERYHSNTSGTWKLQGDNEGIWEDIGSVELSGTKVIYPYPSKAYAKYRWICVASTTTYTTTISELQFYGRKDV